MRRSLTRLSIIGFATLWAGTAIAVAQAPPAARHPEEGRPFVRNILPEEYGGGAQNWAIVQDSRGVVLVGSSGGVLEHDGVSWRLIETPNRSTARSLAITDQDRVYVGAVSDLGYLDADETGTTRFVSLINQIPAGARTFGDIWRTFVLPDGVYFQAEAAIFRWANGAMRVFKPAVRFNRASVVENRLYVPQPGIGLSVLEGDTFHVLPGTLALGDEPHPLVLFYDRSRLLIGTREGGLFLYDGSTLVPFPTEVDDIIRSANLYRGMVMPDRTFLLATTSGGAAIIDHEGRRVRMLDRQSGLVSDTVYYASVDRAGDVWLAGTPGLSRVETPSPMSFFGEDDGLAVGALRIIRHAGTLYVATGQGVSRLQPATAGGAAHLVPVPGIRNQTWWFASIADPVGVRPAELLVAASDGLYKIEDQRAVPVKLAAGNDLRVSALLQSRADPDRVWTALFNGLTSFRRIGGEWIDEGRVEGITDQVRSLVEEPDGTLWAGTQATGLLRLTFSTAPVPGMPRPSLAVERFGPEDGLPTGAAFVQSVAGTPYFLLLGSADPHVAQFDAVTRTFTRTTMSDLVGVTTRTPGFGFEEAGNGRVLLNLGRETAILEPRSDGTWAVDKATLSRIGDGGSFTAYVEPDGVMWLSSRGRLVRFDPSRVSRQPDLLPPLIRVVTANQTDTLYGGSRTIPAAPRLDPSTTALRFDFAVPRFSEEPLEYQSRLEGLDDDWSGWTTETRRDFTNLGLGDYRFRVRARDIAGRVTDDTVYAFTILPPWYRTWTAYAGYLLLALALLAAVDRIQRRRVVGKERARAQLSEAQVRAEAAEALARSEGEGKRNIELISNIGREITASLDFDTIFMKLYEHVKQLAPADVFGVGLYHADRRELEYRVAIENGKRYAPYTRDTSNPNQFPVWCLEHLEPVFINDVEVETAKYISAQDEQRRPLEDGSLSREPQSLIYLPLVSSDRVLGVITIQAFDKHAYTDHHLNVLQSLASYTSVALDNAAAYRQLNEQEHEIRRLFEEAQRARAAAEEADAAKSAFLSTVSHELRTPLTSVLGFAKIIKKRLDERIFPAIRTDDGKLRQAMQQVQDNLQVVVSEGERLTKLIDDVLDLAKIEAGKLEWHMETVSMADVVSHATAATSSLLDQKGLTLRREVPDGLPAVIADRDRLIQVVINLISNAVKFTERGSVTCRAERRGNEVVISVIDTGVGIAPADQAKVFERFKQVGDTLTDKPKGTGLGLPISREIVEHHGGRIWVESEPGQGSTFAFALPADTTVQPVRRTDLVDLVRQLRDHVALSAPLSADRPSRILVVDDDANIRELLTQEFMEAGYDISTAANGRDAVARVREQRPDLIVLDVMMPEMNGFDVAAVLKNDPQTADVPIIILSIVQDRERGYRLGVDRYLTKPIDTDLLFKEVGELIEQKKSHKRVLIVDEDASTVRTLSDVLTHRGFTVAESRWDNAADTARTLQPDVILVNSGTPTPEAVQTLRFEKGLENVLFLVYR